jgi:hypothetical protein
MCHAAGAAPVTTPWGGRSHCRDGQQGCASGAWLLGCVWEGGCNDAQYNIQGGVRGTLMRHYLCRSTAPLTPTTHARGMFKASSATLLIAPCRRALQCLSGSGCALVGAVDLTAITVTANQHLEATRRAQEDSGRTLAHGHTFGKPKTCWTCIVQGCNNHAALVIDTVKGTAVGTNLPVGTAAVPAYFGSGRITAQLRRLYVA